MSLRTKKVIEESFKKLLKEKPLSKISIKEITDGCGVSRMTFYYHFADVYDLARYVSEQDSLRSATTSSGNGKEFLFNVLNSFYNDKEVFYNIYEPIEFKKAKQYLTESLQKVVKLIISQNVNGSAINVDGSDLEKFTLNAIVGCTFDWFNDNMSTPVDEFVNTLYNLTLNLINGSLAQN